MKKNWQKWEESRKMGILKFVFKYGFLFWGLTTAILWTLLMWVLSSFFSFGIDSFTTYLWPALILFPLGGIVWGLSMWYFMEYNYRKIKRARESKQCQN